MAENTIIENDFELSEEDLRNCIKHLNKDDAEFSSIRELEENSTTSIDFSKVSMFPESGSHFVFNLVISACFRNSENKA